MAIDFVCGALDWFARLGLTVRDDAPKTIDLVNREWGPAAGGLAVSIRALPREDPDQLPGISAVMRNVSGAPKHLEIPGWLVFYSVAIARPDGARAGFTAFGRELLKPERRPPGVTLDLAPGQAVETEIPIGSIYDMRAKGEYRVRLSATLPEGTSLASNQIGVPV